MGTLANKFLHLQLKQTKICKYRTLEAKSKILLAGRGQVGGGH